MSRVTLIFNHLKAIAEAIAEVEKLPLKSIERGEKKARGRCHSDGRILIRMHTSKYMEDRTMYTENARTFAHELAHLKHMNHGEEFWNYMDKIVDRFNAHLEYKVQYEKRAFLSSEM